MEANRELDALIAEKVMGLIKFTVPGTKYPVGAFPEADTQIPYFSTDISAAWLVVEKLDGQWSVEGQAHIGWEARLVEASDREDRHEKPFVARASTAPHAICLAALKALER